MIYPDGFLFEAFFVDTVDGIALTDDGVFPVQTVVGAGAGVGVGVWSYALAVDNLWADSGWGLGFDGNYPEDLVAAGGPPGVILLSGQSDGATTVTASLGQVVSLSGRSDGATVVLATFRDFPVFPIPYPLTGEGVVNLQGLVSHGVSQVAATLKLISLMTASSAGVTTITASLYNDNPALYATSAGVTTVTGVLEAVVVSGGETYNELAGTSAGVTTVSNNWFLYIPRPYADSSGYVQARASTSLYLWLQLGVGFDPIDEYDTGDPYYVSQTYPDGNSRNIHDPSLYLWLNLGVGFDPTDDASTHPYFVSQTFPDGKTRDVHDPSLYLWLNLYERPKDGGWGNIGPTPPTVPPGKKVKHPVSKVLSK